MNPANDPLYTLHARQAQRLGCPPLPYPEFRARLPDCHEQDLSALLLPRPEARPAVPAPRAVKFAAGRVCITSNAASSIPPEEFIAALRRHLSGDWGDLDAHDKRENELALRHRSRILSAYSARNGEKFWIITDAGWEVTTVLLPEDY
jgi:hypothetical protein